MKKAILVQCQFVIQLTTTQYLKWEKYNEIHNIFEQAKRFPSVREIDFDGHFGPNIWITLDVDEQGGTVINDVENWIKEIVS